MLNNIMTLQEVANYLRVDKRTVYRMVNSKEIPAFKVRNQWRFKSKDVDKWIEKNTGDDRNNNIDIPVVGHISAGMPILANENIESKISVDKSLLRNKDKIFALRVKGTSMINAGILDGDYILVHQQSVADQGDVVIALIEDEATVKRFYIEKNKVILKPENDIMEPIIIDPSDKNLMIIGKVEGVIRKLW